MTRQHDEEREHRIHYEIIVDAYDEYDPADIVRINASEENLEILNDWLYWNGHPLL